MPTARRAGKGILQPFMGLPHERKVCGRLSLGTAEVFGVQTPIVGHSRVKRSQKEHFIQNLLLNHYLTFQNFNVTTLLVGLLVRIAQLSEWYNAELATFSFLGLSFHRSLSNVFEDLRRIVRQFVRIWHSLRRIFRSLLCFLRLLLLFFLASQLLCFRVLLFRLSPFQL